jgi:hypothetical protein
MIYPLKQEMKGQLFQISSLTILLLLQAIAIEGDNTHIIKQVRSFRTWLSNPDFESSKRADNRQGVYLDRYDIYLNNTHIIGDVYSVMQDATGNVLTVARPAAINTPITVSNSVRLNQAEVEAIIRQFDENSIPSKDVSFAPSHSVDIADADNLTVSSLELKLLPHGSQHAKYIYELKASGGTLYHRGVFWVEAETGKVIRHWEGLNSQWGIGNLGDNKTLTVSCALCHSFNMPLGFDIIL